MADSKAKAAPAARVEKSTVVKAASALLAHLKKTKGASPDLLDTAAPIFISVTLKRTPGRARGRPIQMYVYAEREDPRSLRPPNLVCRALPHSLLNPDDGVECCIIVKDPAKPFKLQLAESPVPGFTKVIGVGKLRKNYKQFKDRRELAGQYDAFFADDRVVRMMPQVCGKTFEQRRKTPVPVKSYGAGWQKELAGARDSTFFYIGSKNVSVKIGKDNMNAEQVADNVMVAVEPVVEHMPRKWKNVQRIDLHSVNTVMLPLYKALPNPSVVDEDDLDFSEDDADLAEEEDRRAALADDESESADEEEEPAKKPSAKRARVDESGTKAGAGAAADTKAGAAAEGARKESKRKGEIAAAMRDTNSKVAGSKGSAVSKLVAKEEPVKAAKAAHNVLEKPTAASSLPLVSSKGASKKNMPEGSKQASLQSEARAHTLVKADRKQAAEPVAKAPATSGKAPAPVKAPAASAKVVASIKSVPAVKAVAGAKKPIGKSSK